MPVDRRMGFFEFMFSYIDVRRGEAWSLDARF